MKLSDETIKQVKENRALIESKDWLKIWRELRNPELNEAFIELGYNPLNGLKEIPSSYFSGSSIKSIEIPNSVTRIENSAFYDCYSLENVEIPNSVTDIGDSVFYNCSSLTSISIPDGVTGIGDSEFDGCSSLTSIKYTGTKEQWRNIDKSDYWKGEDLAIKIICSDGVISLQS